MKRQTALNGNKDQLTPQEMRFARLRVEGLPPVDAYREAFNKPRLKRENCTAQAYRIQRKPQVMAMVETLLKRAEKSEILAHGKWLHMMIDAFNESMAEGNKTAAASFGRLMGQGIGSLQENVNLNDQRPSAETLVDVLAQDDPALAEMLRRKLSGRQDFDA